MNAKTQPDGGGHLFVVHGLLESVVHDAAIVPTSSSFRVRPYWEPLLGASPRDAKPVDWPQEFSRSAKQANIWFLNMGGISSSGRARAIAERAGACVEAIANSGITAQQGRVRPLIVLPVLGIEGGGLGYQRGEMIRLLLEELTSRVAKLPVDVALVAKDPAVHAAAQHIRRQTLAWDLSEEVLNHARRLARKAKSGELALFFGAGVSVPAGLPTWHQLIGLLATDRLRPEQLEHLSVLDQAQLLAALVPELGSRVAAITGRSERPSLAHALLASLRCREAVTTNYDRLYEAAVGAAGGNIASVLPWDPVEASGPWVLKLHGDHTVPSSIVLTRGDFVRYDAMTRPSGAVLQSLFLTRHVLIVGASLTDDNVVRLAYEVDEYRRNANVSKTYGTLLDVDGKPMMSTLWHGQLDWLEMQGATLEARARSLEVFLDAVSAFASRDSSWLLDERFAHLLGHDAALAQDVRELAKRLPSSSAWDPLRDVLRALGAPE